MPTANGKESIRLNLPTKVSRKLRKQAKANDRTVSAEAERILRPALSVA